MHKLTVTSHLFRKTQLSGEYTVPAETTIANFAHSLGIAWDTEALIVVNDQIVEADYPLKDGDHVFLLTPLVGG